MEVRGPVLLPLAVTPLGSLGSQPPCLLLPLPLLLLGLSWAASCKAGRPCALPPGPSSRSCYPFPPPHPRALTGIPAAGVGRPHRYKQPSESAPSPWPSTLRPWEGSAASGTGPEAAGCLGPGGGLTRRTAASRRSHPAAGWAFPPGTPAASCPPGPARARGVGWGQPGPHAGVRRGLRHLWWRQWGTALRGCRTPGAHSPALGCKLYQRARSEPGPPSRRWRGRGRLQQKRPSAVVKTRRKLAEGDSSLPSRHAALIRTKQGLCGKRQLEWSRTLGGPSWDRPHPTARYTELVASAGQWRWELMTDTKLPGYLNDSPRSLVSVLLLAGPEESCFDKRRKKERPQLTLLLAWRKVTQQWTEHREEVHKQEVNVYFVYPSNK